MILYAGDIHAGMRIDSFIAAETELSRSAAARLCEDGNILVNGLPVLKKYAVKPDDEIEYIEPELRECEVVAEDIPLDVIYEDDYVIVINKPSGMVVHPAPGNYSGTLVNALLHHAGNSLSGIGGVMRPGIVHRIDKDTSGLLVVAKCDEAHRSLSEQMKIHGVTREYYALCAGGFSEDSGTVDLPIGRHPTDRKRMAVVSADRAGAREAITHYEVLMRFGQISYLKLRLETGRTHQIRVHMSHIGHPLLGDPVYQKTRTRFEEKHRFLFSGQALHAGRLSFVHPKTGEAVSFEAPLPKEMEEALRILQTEGC